LAFSQCSDIVVHPTNASQVGNVSYRQMSSIGNPVMMFLVLPMRTEREIATQGLRSHLHFVDNEYGRS